MKDTMKYACWGTHYELKFIRGTYQNNGNTAVQIMCKTDGEDFYEPFATLTVNLKPLKSQYKACIDTNNLGMNADLLAHLEKEGVYKETGTYIISGYCTYPVVEFDHEWLDSLTKM